MGPIPASWAAVIISCHGDVLIRNPPEYVQSRPTMGDPELFLFERAVAVGGARYRSRLAAEDESWGASGSGSGSGDSSLAAATSKRQAAILIEMHAIAVQAESVEAQACQRSDCCRPGQGLCESDARGGEGLAQWMRFPVEAGGTRCCEGKRVARSRWVESSRAESSRLCTCVAWCGMALSGSSRGGNQCRRKNRRPHARAVFADTCVPGCS